MKLRSIGESDDRGMISNTVLNDRDDYIDNKIENDDTSNDNSQYNSQEEQKIDNSNRSTSTELLSNVALKVKHNLVDLVNKGNTMTTIET